MVPAGRASGKPCKERSEIVSSYDESLRGQDFLRGHDRESRKCGIKSRAADPSRRESAPSACPPWWAKTFGVRRLLPRDAVITLEQRLDGLKPSSLHLSRE